MVDDTTFWLNYFAGVLKLPAYLLDSDKNLEELAQPGVYAVQTNGKSVDKIFVVTKDNLHHKGRKLTCLLEKRKATASVLGKDPVFLKGTIVNDYRKIVSHEILSRFSLSLIREALFDLFVFKFLFENAGSFCQKLAPIASIEKAEVSYVFEKPQDLIKELRIQINLNHRGCQLCTATYTSERTKRKRHFAKMELFFHEKSSYRERLLPNPVIWPPLDAFSFAIAILEEALQSWRTP